MMKKVLQEKECAVSPVVGVMLMLVVTIIIAAVVAGFSGGMAAGTSKSPQVSIKADYSQSDGMAIYHMGGDVINTMNTKVYVAPTNDFAGYEQLRWAVNTSVLMVSKEDSTDRPWYDSTISANDNARTFQPGDVARVNSTNLGEIQPQTYQSVYSDDSGHGATSGDSQYYGFRSTHVLGQRFILSLVDSAGRTIAQTEVQIKP
jgi:FlaG/FlaF family flagellin (archaellin)